LVVLLVVVEADELAVEEEVVVVADPFGDPDKDMSGDDAMDEEEPTDPTRKQVALIAAVDGTNQGIVGDIRNMFPLGSTVGTIESSLNCRRAS
jgi:hypothetical protein